MVYQIAKQVSASGYAFVEGRADRQTTIELASKLGSVVLMEKILPGSDIPTVQTLIPKRKSEAPKNRYSGVFGFKSFPLHSDLAHWALPPKYILLRCVKGSSDVETQVVPFSAILNCQPKGVGKRAVLRPVRNRDERPVTALPVIFETESDSGYRWDELFLTPANSAARQISDAIGFRYSFKDEISTIVLNNTGDFLLIDNWKCLHGRGEVGESGENRVIERVYLSEIYNNG